MSNLSKRVLNDSQKLSESLLDLRSKFADFEHGGVTLGGAEVRELRDVLAIAVRLARYLEIEVAGLRGSDDVLRDAEIQARLAAELKRPGTNVVLMAGYEEIPFGDGIPGVDGGFPGGAA